MAAHIAGVYVVYVMMSRLFLLYQVSSISPHDRSFIISSIRVSTVV